MNDYFYYKYNPNKELNNINQFSKTTFPNITIIL